MPRKDWLRFEDVYVKRPAVLVIALTHAVLGLIRLTESHHRTKIAAYRSLASVMPLRWWGGAFLLAGAVMLLGLVRDWTTVVFGSILLGACVLTGWSIGLAIAADTYGTSYGGIPIYFGFAVLQSIACAPRGIALQRKDEYQK